MAPCTLPDTPLTSALVALLTLAPVGCEPGPRMSPWGVRDVPPLGAFVERPDLERSLAAIETEARAIGLRVVSSARVADRAGTPYVVQALVGRDRLGRLTSAARVASPWGVVLALGPLRESDAPLATELVPFLDAGPDRSLKLPADLTGDGDPEIVLTGSGSKLAIFSLEPHGATELAVEINGGFKGLYSLGTAYALRSETTLSNKTAPLSPRLGSLSTFAQGRFSTRSKAAKEWHGRERDARATPPEAEGQPARLNRLLEQSWHAALAGAPLDDALAPVDKEKPPAELASALDSAKAELRQRLR